MYRTVISKGLLMARCWLCCCLSLIVQAGQAAENGDAQATKNRVFIKHGNIFYTDGKKTIQLTRSGKDDEPVLSPNGKCVAFVRETARKTWTPDCRPIPTRQLWLVDVDGTHEKMLVKDRGGDPETLISQIGAIQFSPDGRWIYFSEAYAWHSASALHRVNVDGTGERFIIDANDWRVIEKGRDKGNLIVCRQKQFLYGGSYFWYYIITPEGKEIGPLAEEAKNIPWEDLYREPIKKAK